MFQNPVDMLSGPIGVLGAGQMGTALANHLSRSNHVVYLWMRSKELLADISTKTNTKYFPGIKLDEKLKYTTDLSLVLKKCPIIVFSIPSSAIRGFLNDAVDASYLQGKYWIVSTIKGIPEGDKIERASELIQVTFPNSSLAVLSGPNIAKEILVGLPTTTCIAGRDASMISVLSSVFQSPTLIVTLSDDPTGVELCGSFKNVITIGVGLFDGMGLGENVKGVVVAQGFQEVSKLVLACGGKRAVLYSPAGLEDFLVASYSGKSRNYLLGQMMGQGHSINKIHESFGHITFEGVRTTKLTKMLAEHNGIDTPLIDCVDDIVCNNINPQQAFDKFWDRIRLFKRTII